MRARSPERPHELWLLAAGGLLLLLASGWRPFASRGFEPGAREPGVLRIVTWNVGERTDAGASALRPGALAHVLESLRTLDPDLVLLQEVGGREQAAALAEGLDGGRGEGSRASWSLATAPGGGRRVIALAKGALSTFSVPRGGSRALGVHATLAGGVEVDAVALHADAFSARRRNRLLGAAADRLREVRRGPRVLFGGDLNLEVDPDRRRDLTSDDAYLDLESFHYAARGMVDAGSGTGPTADPDRRIDYLLVDPGGFELVRAGPWRDRRVGAMDHDPLVADLRLR